MRVPTGIFTRNSSAARYCYRIARRVPFLGGRGFSTARVCGCVQVLGVKTSVEILADLKRSGDNARRPPKIESVDEKRRKLPDLSDLAQKNQSKPSVNRISRPGGIIPNRPERWDRMSREVRARVRRGADPGIGGERQGRDASRHDSGPPRSPTAMANDSNLDPERHASRENERDARPLMRGEA